MTFDTIRLPEDTLRYMREIFRDCFLANDELWLFGSRIDNKKRGGDIDLYIETDLQDYAVAIEQQITFLSRLKNIIGDQKIDVVLRLRSSDHHLPIYDVAKSEGVRLI